MSHKDKLPPRKYVVWKKLAEGLDNSQIARDMNITTKSVENCVRDVYHYLGLWGPGESTDTHQHKRVLAAKLWIYRRLRETIGPC